MSASGASRYRRIFLGADAVIYRLYFNRCEDFPQIWSIDEGDSSTEVNVIAFGHR